MDSGKSTLGYIFFLVGGAISWNSSNQTIVTSSTIEAKFIACYEATLQALWLKNFIFCLKFVDTISRPLKIFCDNSTVVYFSKNNKSSSQSKNIDIKYLMVRDHIKRQEVIIEHISTKVMIVDSMTKGLPTKLFQDHATHLQLRRTSVLPIFSFSYTLRLILLKQLLLEVINIYRIYLLIKT